MAKKRPKGVSKREWEAAKAGKPAPYNKGGREQYGSLVDQIATSILGVAPKEKKAPKDFDDVYTSKLQKEDEDQARSMFEPFYNEKINGILEDLNTVMQMESVNYERSLRRARASMAQAGGAIGTERTNAEGEMNQDYQTNRNIRIRSAEKQVGTERIKGAGYTPTNNPLEGSLISEMKQNIAEQTLWNKQQRANRYYSDVSKYFKT
jgi:hypothetical protein